ncbi:MAG: DUF3089 domain-containing protein [Bacteroidota bacterium]
MNLRLFLLLFVFGSVVIMSCAIRPTDFSPTSVPSAPDYSLSENWAALPSKSDNADLVPGDQLTDQQARSKVDVFFMHPTTYTRKGTVWNGSVGDKKLNEKTDDSTIKYQATIFNGVGKVYAPRYRQAHLTSFYSKDKQVAQQALDLAYEDLARAFDYYLENYNQGRPIIIAAHSQGALHAKKLLKEYFDGKPLQNSLVAAYVVGWPVLKNEFNEIKPCETPEQNQCICSWRTFKYGHIPKGYLTGDSVLVTNPLSWKTNDSLVGKEFHKGAVVSNFSKVFPRIADAKIEQGILWTHKPKFPGAILFNRKNYHIADMNFFYVDIRENARLRAASFEN